MQLPAPYSPGMGTPDPSFGFARILEVMLRQQFPEAKFIHIVRNPYQVFPSTLRMWKALYRYHELQTSNYEQLENYVLECGRRLYDALDEGKREVPDGHFAELRYEDLIADPLAAIERLYCELDLGDFAAARPQIQSLADEMGNYRSRRHLPNEADCDLVAQHWGDIVARHGYESPTLATPAGTSTTTSPLAPPLPASTL